jgi:hypothetical protein
MESWMPDLELAPLQGLGPLRFGDYRATAREKLSKLGFGLESSHGASDYFCDAAIQVEYSADNSVWFVGLSASDRFRAWFQGRDIFSLTAEEVFLLLAASEGAGEYTYNCQEYFFPKQVLTLWDADEQYDRKGNETRPFWGQIGIGSSSYAAAVESVRSKI